MLYLTLVKTTNYFHFFRSMKLTFLFILGGLITVLFMAFVVNNPTDLIGNGNVTTRLYKLNTINKIEINGVFKTILTPTLGTNEVKVETDNNLQSSVEVIQTDGRLVVRTRKGMAIKSSTKMNVYIGVKKFDELDYKLVGNLEMPSAFALDSLQINSNAVGKTQYNFQANFIRLNLKNIGETTLLGSAKEARINNRSVGKLNALDFSVENLYIHNEAIGAVEVNAIKEISIRHKGVGKFSYKGNPVVKELKDEGIGKIEKL